MIQSNRVEEAAGWSASLGKWFHSTPQDRLRILGPAAAPIVRLKRIYRFHLVLKAENRVVLAKALREALNQAEIMGIPRKALILDVDPVNLM
jgi:primosomal protein N' (replication factor Y)